MDKAMSNKPDRYKILIVDDDKSNIASLGTLLKDDYKILVAKNGEQALKIAFANMPPDLILLDIIMPGIDGYEVCRQIKAEPKAQQIPIIFLSAMSGDTDETKGLELGAVDYITKPFSPAIVLARVKTHLKLKQAYKDLENHNATLKEMAVLRQNVEQITHHDLKNPLSGIIGFSGLLQTRCELEPKPKELVNKIEKAGYKMLEMLNGSLDLYKMETGVYQYQADMVDILSVLQKIVVETKQMADSLNLAIEIRLRGKLVTENDTLPIKGEQLLCYSMFANLLKNAIEASPREASITISVDDSKDLGIISIHNQGAIPLEIRDKFFDKYVTAKKYGGTGLGTYSAKLMAEIQGGTIQFNTSEETGTTIMVQLPK